MGAVHAHAITQTETIDAQVLQRRLKRERQARQCAEELLETKSKQLYNASQALRITASNLESQRIQLNTILEHTLASIFLARHDLTIKQVNRAGLEMFGINGEYYADILISDLFAGPPAARDWIESQMKGDAMPDDTHREAVGRRLDGAEFPIEFAVTALEHDGKRHSVWVVRDITRRKREELKRAKLEHDLAQAQKFEALGTLSSGIAHEINTPVQYVSDNVRFLKDTFHDLIGIIKECQGVLEATDSPAAAAARERIAETDLGFLMDDAPAAIDQSLDGLDQVASIVKAIKAFAHPGADEKAPLDINQIVETTATVTRNQWKYVAHLKTDLASDLPPVPCHAGDMNQVLLNLIVNAADAIDVARDDGTLGDIHVRTRAVGSSVEITVTDTGCGMTDDVKARIFDPFFTTKDVGKGTGQGLSIVYNIVCAKHGGELVCESTPGGGATFTVRLPLTPQEGSEDPA